MSFIADIFAGGAAGILAGVKDVVSTFKADPLEVMRLQAAIAQSEAQLALGLAQAQTKVNELEAVSQDKFVSRWRPAIGWICGAAYAYSFVLQPFGVFLLTASGYHLEASQLPHIQVGELSMVLMGMLGLGAMRSWDKQTK
jgi:roadblock/LC7 domain-containing protein